jgi:hypothetical protein
MRRIHPLHPGERRGYDQIVDRVLAKQMVRIW